MPRTGKRFIEHLNVRVPTSEMELLRQYCNDTQRTQSDVIREFIRSLKSAVPNAPEKPRADIAAQEVSLANSRSDTVLVQLPSGTQTRQAPGFDLKPFEPVQTP